MTPPIAILGAGLAGLTLAQLLEKANIDYLIFERDECAASAAKGGALDIHVGTGQTALQEIGLLDSFRTLARFDAPTVIADKEGHVNFTFSQPESEMERPEIDRQALRYLLLESIPEEKLRWSSKIERVVKGEDGLVSIHIRGQSTVESGFRLVVGADGGWSKARSLVTSALPQYDGKCYLTSTITPSSPIYAHAKSVTGNGNYIAMGSGKMLVSQRMGDGSYTVNIGLELPEQWSKETELLADPPALRQWLLRDCLTDWAPTNTDLLRHSEGGFRAWPLYGVSVEDMSWETVAGVTLVGDAAHITPPSGEGANIAMYDSLQLAQQIVKHGLDNLAQAVAEYEKEMFARAIPIIKDAAKMSEVMYAADAPAGMMKAFSHEFDDGESPASWKSEVEV